MESIHIQNDYLSAGVLQKGAELCSLISKETGREYIWQADKNIWGSYAPVLFPVIGNLKEGSYLYNGKSYFLPKHGMVRNNNNLEITERTETSVSLRLTSSEETLAMFPFQFEFVIKYTLEGKKLLVKHTVTNNGDKVMYFSLGAHPGFNCPLFDNEKYEDYYVELNVQEENPAVLLDSDGLVGKEIVNILEDGQRLNLTDKVFDRDALIFRNIKSDSAKLVSRKSGDVLKMKFKGFPYLGIWAKPRAPFVCIEPWQGIADNYDTNQKIEDKEGIMELKQGALHLASYSIEIL